ncbi:right-handed parallel beta-helix repeat-containing protein [Ferdinandcohnia quinoae]|uniref:right-handed parallel beta-helix repeat-containing protein n=1 Tax=Fredinandcohnia quinoae TaxID=2918902 RepID=UPI001F05E9C3|nr:right-handed parallel beta-helix repeat-containing protein [Fredinandcohnia sp. SECRCQ15]
MGSQLVHGEQLQSVSSFDELVERIVTAQPGETITLEAGEYHGQLLINKEITLQGKDGTHIIGPSSGYPIIIEAENVTIKNLHIEGGGTQNAGIYIKSNRNKIINNSFKNVFHGIYIKDGYGNEIANNTITSFSKDVHKGFGIYLVNAPQTKISNNYLYDLQDGIYVSYSDYGEVTNNLIENARYGIHTMDSKNVVISKNEVRKSHNGLMIMQSSDLFITENILHMNTTIDGAGMFIYDTFDSVIKVNVMKGNFKGIFFENAQRNTVEFNTFQQNDIGFDLGKASKSNLIYLNNFNKNTKQIISASGNKNLFSRDGYGNYWDDQRSINLNGDEFIDFPYKSGDIFFNMTNKEPLLQVFFQSPAVYLWNKIEQFTPIPADHFIIDEHTLVSPAPIKLDFLNSTNDRKSKTSHSLLQILFFSSIVCFSGFLLWKTRRKKSEN